MQKFPRLSSSKDTSSESSDKIPPRPLRERRRPIRYLDDEPFYAPSSSSKSSKSTENEDCSSATTEPNYWLSDEENDELSDDEVEDEMDEDYLCGVSCTSSASGDQSINSSHCSNDISAPNRLQQLEVGENVEIIDGHGWTWTSQPNFPRVRGVANVLQHLKSGVTDFARSQISEKIPESPFLLFLDTDMRKKIIDSTNGYCNAHIK